MNPSLSPLHPPRSPHPKGSALFWLVLLLTLNACSSVSWLDSGPQPRLYSGQQMPEVGLRDARGENIRLHSLLGKVKRTVVVFYRGYWCPYSQEQFSLLRARWSDFQAREAQIVGISVDDPPMLAEFAHTLERACLNRAGEGSQQERGESPILLLSDSSREAIRRLGIAEEHPRFGLIPRPTTVVLDREGTVLWIYAGRSASPYPSVDLLLRQLGSGIRP